MSTSETSTLQPNTPVPPALASAPTSKAPMLGEGFQETTRKFISHSTDTSDVEYEDGQENSEGSKHGKRRLFGFGKKKSSDKGKARREHEGIYSSATDVVTTQIAQPIARRVVPIPNASPPRSTPNHPYQIPSSPQRNLFSSSPRIASPAGSQIFERDVQESSLTMPTSPAIPSHIQTENHIPAVLDASSEAITNGDLDPDSVEIITLQHQPAAVTVTGVNSMEQSWSTWADELIPHPDKDDSASNYGALDNSDLRRLSFISFSDIVQSEHAEHVGNRDSIYVAGLSSLSSGNNRSPSPIRSPVSSQSASVQGFEMSSPRGKPMGSPISTHPPAAGELTIETMGQALRRTASGDLSGSRSQPMSPSSPDALSEKSFPKV